ncbi:hypothetical protein FA13DRAFT_1727396 [Coprinellus micaceus]|uniref:Uncharacterized protein n=1 Tax=Coprinellus micaceus TaxID=71717 RepID=A0A4Y7TNT4_COPMI|nr:hypothetical protein FA13DRAFT_1727396 [Coprinellus micaceus]
MPETRECICCGVITEERFEHVCKKGHDLHIKAIWIDPTETEAPIHSPHGYAFTLDNTSPPFCRGNANHQKPLFPPTLSLEKTEDRPDPPLIRTPRALILGFQQSDEDGGRTLFLKVCYLKARRTHVFKFMP